MAGKSNSLRVGFIIIIVIITNKNIIAIKEERETQTVWQHLRRIVTPRRPLELILSYSRPKCDNLTSEVIKFSVLNFENKTSIIKTNTSTTSNIISSSTNSPETTTTDILVNIDDAQVEKFWHDIPHSEHASKSVKMNEPDDSAVDEAIDDFDKYDYILEDDSKTPDQNQSEKVT